MRCTEKARTLHVSLMAVIVLWVAAIVVVLVYGAHDLSREPRQVLADAGGESHESSGSRVR
jgi:hypothetical protein